MISDKEKYINLSTKKKDSTLVNTPVWFAQDEDITNKVLSELNNKKFGISFFLK